MAESTLSLEFAEYQAEVGDYLGEQRSGWDTPTTARIAAIIKQAYGEALYPDPFPGKAKGHQWSFLEPIATLTTTAADYDIDLPETFGSILGPLTIESATSGYRSIPVVGEGAIRQMRTGAIVSGPPQYAATRPKAGFTGTSTGQRSELLLYPTPDAVYTISYKSSLIVNLKLDATNKYPIGGMSFGYLLLARCLAVAEFKYRDGETAKQAAYQTRLAAEISRDLQNAPEYLGYNANRSGGMARSGRRYLGDTFTYEGQPTSP